MSDVKKNNILFIMTGSIACYKACGILSKLKQNGYTIKVVMSSSSHQFIGAATIEGLTGEVPYTDLYKPGEVMGHIHLDRWADLIIVAPATAHFINKIAVGLGDDLLTTLFLAHDFKKPFLIAPAMNTMMYLHPTTQNSLQKLKHMNVEILEAASGVLACGEVGYGRLLEPDLIVQEIENRLQNQIVQLKQIKPILNKKNKILITSGGTSEPIDDIRVITNISTGRTAAQIADALIESGFDVTYLHSEKAILPKNPCKKISFNTFYDLENSLKTELQKEYHFVLHAAAVSDYAVVSFEGKINSDQSELILKLKKNPKLIDSVKKINPKIKLIGFKLTSTQDQNVINQKVASLFENAQCDYVIQNDWNNIKAGNRQFSFYKNKNDFFKVDGVQQLSSEIFQKLAFNASEAL